ncbi:MAG: MarR family winged helix-turn-helix transcriptional regulator [Saccharospirillum sp.]
MAKHTDTPAQLQLSQQICHSLYSATNALVRAYRPLLAAVDLTYPQYLVMLALWEESDVPIKSLVARTRLDSGTLTPILKRLEAKGLVQRVRSRDDERQRLIAVTPAGWARRDACLTIPEQLWCQAQLTETEALTLKTMAERLYQQLDTGDAGTA